MGKRPGRSRVRPRRGRLACRKPSRSPPTGRKRRTANATTPVCWDALGQIESFGYTEEEQLASITYSNLAAGTAATPNVSLTYEPTYGRVETMTDGTGTTTYTYDPIGVPHIGGGWQSGKNVAGSLFATAGPLSRKIPNPAMIKPHPSGWKFIVKRTIERA